MLDGPLTSRERQVLVLVADGRTSAEIAEALGVAVCTVDRQAATAVARLGARSRRHAALMIRERFARTDAALRPDEREVLTLLAEGSTIDQAAKALNYSRRTIARRIARARDALSVATTTQALAAFMEIGSA